MSDGKKASAAKHPRVLVAEDEALIRFDLVELLNDEGYEVVGQAGDGEKAVELARELRPDLVVMDVKMPKMDGIAAAGNHRIRAHRAGGHADGVQPARPGRAGP